MTLADAIIAVFKDTGMTQDDGRIIWAMLANNSLYVAGNEPAVQAEGRIFGDLSESFRGNGAQVKTALCHFIGGPREPYDYMDYYCSEATEEEAATMADKFRAAGFVVVMDADCGHIYLRGKRLWGYGLQSENNEGPDDVC